MCEMEEKQIEEMLKCICMNCRYFMRCNDDTIYKGERFSEILKKGCSIWRHGEAIYNAGYRKQSEGEWVWINQAISYLEPPYGDTCKCSLCKFEIDVSESNYKYCPNCGARMKSDVKE